MLTAIALFLFDLLFRLIPLVGKWIMPALGIGFVLLYWKQQKKWILLATCAMIVMALLGALMGMNFGAKPFMVCTIISRIITCVLINKIIFGKKLESLAAGRKIRKLREWVVLALI